MNHRAFSAMIVLMIVAVFVIGVVALAIGTKFHPSASTFLESIIGFGTDNSTSRSFEALRYNITSDTLSYYTGSDFVVIAPGTHVLLNDKYLESDLIRKALSDYYFSLDARLFYASGQPAQGTSPTYRFSLAPDYRLTASVVSFSSATQLLEATSLPRRGDVDLIVTNYSVRESQQGTTIVNTIIGEALVRTTNDFVFSPHKDFEDFSLTNEQKQDLLRQVIAWRDSILKGGSFETTLDVPYRKKATTNPLTVVTVQPERDSTSGDIILRLDQEVVRKNAADELSRGIRP